MWTTHHLLHPHPHLNLHLHLHLHLPLIPPKPPVTHLPLTPSANGSLKTAAGSPLNPNTRITQDKLLQQTHGGEDEERRKQIKGSDVLWALQKAAAKKKRGSGDNKKRIPRGNPSSAEAEDCLDYSKVRPIRIKSDWPRKLDELEKRVKELHDS